MRSEAARATTLRPATPEEHSILQALADPVFVVDEAGRFVFVNLAAEQFFAASATQLDGRALAETIPADSPLVALVAKVREEGVSASEHGVTLETPKIGSHLVTIQATPLAEQPGEVVVSIHERSSAFKMHSQLSARGAARSVTAMAAMLAHEVKNPLSGIRGAAQLLEQSAAVEDRVLTRLICDEADRICALIDRMEVFSDGQPIARSAVNIHEVLERARLVAQSGFGRHVRFVERYDPSLPPVFGNFDILVQVVLNLVKNACEAAPEIGGEIVLSTAYLHGIRVNVAGTETRMQLPLQVSIQDNGPGIPEDLRVHLFEPFVTTKVNGSGFGLAFVAKATADHGGVVEFESQPQRTVFRLMLPVVPPDGSRRTTSRGRGARGAA